MLTPPQTKSPLAVRISMLRGYRTSHREGTQEPSTYQQSITTKTTWHRYTMEGNRLKEYLLTEPKKDARYLIRATFTGRNMEEKQIREILDWWSRDLSPERMMTMMMMKTNSTSTSTKVSTLPSQPRTLRTSFSKIRRGTSLPRLMGTTLLIHSSLTWPGDSISKMMMKRRKKM